MQRQGFTCDGDGCGEEIGTVDAPVIYVVAGTVDGTIATDVRLPAFIWEIIKTPTKRKDFSACCFVEALQEKDALKLMTLEEHDAAAKEAASAR